MFSLFSRKVGREKTFKDRVQQFWEWYAQVSPRFYQTIESGQCSTLAEEVSARLDQVLPDFAWVFGPGEGGQGHSFTLSGEGNRHRQLLAIYWLGQAPTLPGWTFYAARQAGSIKGQNIETGGRKFDPLEFWITPVVDRAQEKLNITVWHPLFDSMAEQQRWMVLFLFLDEVLGEYGTQQWIGEIKHDPQRLADSIPLEELREFVAKTQSKHGWKKYPPGVETVLYKCKEPHSRFLRGDIITGVTFQPRLLEEYLAAEGNLEDPLRGTGADYVFVAFDSRILPVGNEVTARGRIEDGLDLALRKCASGRLLGGAMGAENSYIDLLLFDGSNSIEIVQQALRDHKSPAGYSINYFARDKRGRRSLIQ